MATDNEKNIAAKCWRQGNDAALQESFDYAVKMLSTSVKLVPDNRLYRETLRGVERKKYKDNQTGARMAGLKTKKAKAKLANFKRQKKWVEADQAAEEGLLINPWDAQLNADMAEACNNLGYKDCAIYGYSCALASDRDHPKNNEALAYLLEEKGDYAQAIECWKRVYDADPTNGDARSKMTQLAAESVMERGGYEKADSTKDVKTGYDYNRPAKTNIPTEVEGPGVSLEADLQRALRKDASDIDSYLKLADFYQREKRLGEAAETLQKALQVKPDFNIREKLEDVELAVLKQNLDTAKMAAAADKSDEVARKNAIALAKELLDREIEVFSARVDRYQTNSDLKYELATRFIRRKRFDEAIKLLQGANVKGSRSEVKVLVTLGECFLHEKKRALAHKQFIRAAEKLNFQDHPDAFKKVHYTLGRFCEEEKNRDQAEDHYNEVLAVDYEYRDTLSRLEALQGGGADDS